ncbi:alanine racemase [bacterium]|nr:alanine racemase [bacterium]MBU4310261.1 alanine racemase [bacterium]MBU4561178.1 alanine racemase [bacterium]MCG2676528.1 alanine racemase [bacterium]MCG2678021.1 alanine racemase [bacterium]
MDSQSTWAEIDLAALIHNFKEIRKKVGPDVGVMAIVKAQGYGHGMVQVSRPLEKEGVNYFGVTSPTEAFLLRKEGIESPILILGPTLLEKIEKIIKKNITQTICTKEMALALQGECKRFKKRLKVHIEVDTGMGRTGVPHQRALKLIKEIIKIPELVVEGIFTHFSTADEEDKSFTKEQIKKFKEILEKLEKEKINIPLKHAANSAGILGFPESYFNMVRPGLALYGIYPSRYVSRSLDLHPVMSLKSKVIYLKRVKKGATISYGKTYVTNKNTTIAILPIGYEDGYNRLLSNKGEVIIRGKRVRIAGRVCMDQTIIDVGEVPDVKVGDEAVLIGKQGGERVSVEEIAEKVNTVPHEVVCRIAGRVPRVYLKSSNQ